VSEFLFLPVANSEDPTTAASYYNVAPTPSDASFRHQALGKTILWPLLLTFLRDGICT